MPSRRSSILHTLLLVVCLVTLLLCDGVSCKTAKADDYYSILNVPRSANDAQIKKAYRSLAMKYHPDKSSAPNAQAVFERISEAYEILSDKEKRATYDQYGADAFKPGGQQQQQHQTPHGQQFHSNNGAGTQYTFHTGGQPSHGQHQFSDPRKLFEKFFGGSDPFADLFNVGARSQQPSMFGAQQNPATQGQRQRPQQKPQQDRKPTAPIFAFGNINTLTKQMYNSQPFNQCPLSILLIPSSPGISRTMNALAKTMLPHVIGSTKATYFVVDDADLIKTLRSSFNIQTSDGMIVAYRGKQNKFAKQVIDGQSDIETIARTTTDKLSDGSMRWIKQTQRLPKVK